MDKNLKLYQEMVSYFTGDPRRCQHFIKVAGLCRYLALAEGADSALVSLVEAAGLVHDCGIKVCEAKYGKGHCGGKQQEEEGPAVAREMLTALGYAPPVVERVAYLVGHHHTYTAIDGLDYQILIEADFLVNFYEDAMPENAIRQAVKKVFRTGSGIKLAEAMFALGKE